MPCVLCLNERHGGYLFVCPRCYLRDENLPANVMGPQWITILPPYPPNEKHSLESDQALRELILGAFETHRIVPDSERGVVNIAGKMEVKVSDEQEIDSLARRSGLVVGKWLVYSSPESINQVWKALAPAFVAQELGDSIKVSTATPEEASREYVICVYTENYLDTADVQRVREKLRSLGFDKPLYYKPDLYTYLQIYRRTFPRLKASRYCS